MSDTPIFDLTMSQWTQGAFFSLVGSLHYPAAQAESLANRMTSCRPAVIHPNDIEEIIRVTRALESAAQTLRSVVALGKPAPALMAAE